MTREDYNEQRRNATHCARGHNDWGYKSRGTRYCRTCNREKCRKYRGHAPTLPEKPAVIVPLSYEDRRKLKAYISEIQRRRELSARRMHVTTTYGKKLFLGGDSRPVEEQVRSGYPSVYDKVA